MDDSQLCSLADAGALRVAAIRDPKGGPSVESAISLGYIGLGMIIFAAALFLAGLVVMARRM